MINLSIVVTETNDVSVWLSFPIIHVFQLARLTICHDYLHAVHHHNNNDDNNNNDNNDNNNILLLLLISKS